MLTKGERYRHLHRCSSAWIPRQLSRLKYANKPLTKHILFTRMAEINDVPPFGDLSPFDLIDFAQAASG
jgi:hypothetical protein